MRLDGRAAALRLAALTVGPACLVGQAIMLAERAPLALLLTDLAALVGGLVAAALWVGRLDDLITARPGRVLGAGLVLVAAAFPFASTGGVHRWWLLGSVRVHASALCAPLVMVAVVRLWRLRRWRAAAAGASAIQALHVLQPDAGQATAVGLALAVAAVGLVGRAPRERERDLGVGLAAVAAGAGAALAWLRLDPLAPLPFVEQIVGVAFARGWWLGALSVWGLLALALGPWWAARRWRVEVVSVETHALVGYYAGALLAAAAGAFPVPVLGHGASPVVGAILAAGLLGHRAGRQPVAAAGTSGKPDGTAD